MYDVLQKQLYFFCQASGTGNLQRLLHCSLHVMGGPVVVWRLPTMVNKPAAVPFKQLAAAEYASLILLAVTA